MSKYINADELKEQLKEYSPTTGQKDDYCDGKNYMWSVAKNLINKMPSADVVEVVRCKDCKYREEYKIFGRPTAYYCLRGCVDSNLSLNENDYCCWGERKETE